MVLNEITAALRQLNQVKNLQSITQRHKSYLDASYGVRQTQWSSAVSVLEFCPLQLRQTKELSLWTSSELTPTQDPWYHSAHTLQPT